jgi:hypothetical protein
MQARILTASLFLTLPSAMWAQEWEKLGSRKVDFGADKDVLNLTGEGALLGEVNAAHTANADKVEDLVASG